MDDYDDDYRLNDSGDTDAADTEPMNTDPTDTEPSYTESTDPAENSTVYNNTQSGSYYFGMREKLPYNEEDKPKAHTGKIRKRHTGIKTAVALLVVAAMARQTIRP